MSHNTLRDLLPPPPCFVPTVATAAFKLIDVRELLKSGRDNDLKHLFTSPLPKSQKWTGWHHRESLGSNQDKQRCCTDSVSGSTPQTCFFPISFSLLLSLSLLLSVLLCRCFSLLSGIFLAIFSLVASASSILTPFTPSSPFHSKIMMIMITTIISSCLLIVLQEHGVLSISDHRWLPKPSQPGGWIVGSQWGRRESVGGTQKAAQNHSTANPSDNEMPNTGKCSSLSLCC